MSIHISVCKYAFWLNTVHLTFIFCQESDQQFHWSVASQGLSPLIFQARRAHVGIMQFSKCPRSKMPCMVVCAKLLCI